MLDLLLTHKVVEMQLKGTLFLGFLVATFASPMPDADFYPGPAKESKYLITLYATTHKLLLALPNPSLTPTVATLTLKLASMSPLKSPRQRTLWGTPPSPAGLRAGAQIGSDSSFLFLIAR